MTSRHKGNKLGNANTLLLSRIIHALERSKENKLKFTELKRECFHCYNYQLKNGLLWLINHGLIEKKYDGKGLYLYSLIDKKGKKE